MIASAPNSFDIDVPIGAAARAVRPIDLVHLARFTMGDPALEQEILALFIQQAPLTIDRLLQARTERQWREAAHTLKGSARAVGAWRMAQAAEASERMPGWQQPSAVEATIEEIQAAFSEVDAFIGVLRQSRAA